MDTPVYRIDILKKAKEYLKTGKYPGICPAILKALEFYEIPFRLYYLSPTERIMYYIPLHNLINAKKFQTDKYLYNPFWWKSYKFNIFSGRRRYLNWLIRRHKNDKTNLREL